MPDVTLNQRPTVAVAVNDGNAPLLGGPSVSVTENYRSAFALSWQVTQSRGEHRRILRLRETGGEKCNCQKT